MKKSLRYTLITVLLMSAYLLNACAGLPPADGGSGDDATNSQVNVNDDNANDANANDNNGNDSDDNNGNGSDDNSNGNSNDDSNENTIELTGVIEAIAADSVTINGVTYQLADFTEIKDVLVVGADVKIHVIVNADGSFTITEIELSNGSDDNSNDSNSNDDNSNNSNSNDDNSNDDNSNSNNDDDDDDDNSNDDDGNGNDNGSDD